MKTKSSILVFLFALAFFATGCYREEIILIPQPNENIRLQSLLYLDGKPCFFDEASHTLRYSISPEDINNFTPKVGFLESSQVWFCQNLLINGKTKPFGNIEYNTRYPLRLVIANDTLYADLVFTPLPIVRITQIFPVYDEPKMPAFIEIVYPETEKPCYSGYIAIEYRGVTSQTFPKKSYGFKTLVHQDKKEYKKVALTGDRANHTWILDAAYIDAGRIRNMISFAIWGEIQGNKPHYSVNARSVEMFINNNHQGLYCLNENFNSDILSLQGNDEVLYKAVDWGNGATSFSFASDQFPLSFYWDGWEQKHPDPEFFINWLPLRNLRNLIVNSSDAVFADSIGDYIDLDNFIDYFLFLNLISAYDNCGKNIFLIKSNITEKFLIIPWDMDGAWGLFWDGLHIAHTGIITNNLYDRLFEINPKNYKAQVKQRWFELRNTVFTEQNITGKFNKSLDLITISGVMTEENRIWSLNISPESEKAYLNEWIPIRLEFLDTFFSQY